MKSKVPVSSNINWLYVILQILIFCFFIAIFYFLVPEFFIFYAYFFYFTLYIVLKTQIPKYHRKGMSLVKKELFAEAIPFFKKSYDFFNKNNWIDKYRWITFFSASDWCYKEIALTNIAFCYGQLGNGTKAKEFYDLTLQHFPNNAIAITGLRMINSFQNQD